MPTKVKRVWAANYASGFEMFPEGRLGARQINDLLTMRDSEHGVVTGIWTAAQHPILQLTEDGIVEINVKLGSTRAHGIWDKRAVIWMTDRNNWIASCVAIGKPEDDTVEGYMWMPDHEGEPKRRMGQEPITVQYEHGFTSLGNMGAIAQIREFIKKHYVEED